MIPEPLLNEKQVADILGIALDTLRGWRYRGNANGDRGPEWVKVGRFVRYRREKVDAYIESRNHN